MTLKIDLIFFVPNGKGKLRNIVKRIAFCFCSYIFITSFIFAFVDTASAEAASTKNDKLIERISKDYTNKFCNSIAFGLAKDSSMNFANKENNLIYKKKKGFDDLNKDLLAKKISSSVVEGCGYLINLRGEKGILEFEKDYILKNNFLSIE